MPYPLDYQLSLERTPDPNVDWDEVCEGKQAPRKGAIDV